MEAKIYDKIRFYPMTERVYWLSKSTKTKFKNNINSHDLFEWRSVGTRGVHKRAFPESMVQILLIAILLMLSCSTLFLEVAQLELFALNLDMKFIGIEIDKEYYDISKQGFKMLQMHNKCLWLYEWKHHLIGAKENMVNKK